MKVFDTFEKVDGLSPCLKRPIVVHAKRINEEFRVNTLEGNYKQGKAGDYLMQGIDGELYICDGDIFERSYDFTFEDDGTAADDFVTDASDGLQVLVDAMSMNLLSGAEIDFKRDLTSSQFIIRNPNASATCGCGSSFSV